jgi:hypothetical protein
MRTGALLVVALSVASLACEASSDGDATAGKRVVLRTSATAEPSTRSAFTTGFGWDVTLTRAAVAVAGLYYFDGPPPTAMWRAPRPTLRERVAGLFERTAWAHPGHYQAGTALGQVILAQPIGLDLLGAQPIALPSGEGVTGTYRSARFVLPEAAPLDPALGGHLAVVEGRATRHDGSSPQPIFFRLVADYADISASITNGAVDGCVLDEVTVHDDGTITVEIRPLIWLNLVDFSKIAPGAEGSPTEAKSAGFSQGVTQLSAYHFTYSE